VVIIISILFLLSKPAVGQDIHDAAWKGDLSKVQKLLAENPQLLNAKGPWGWTPLQRAVYFNHSDIVSYLISKGSDVNIRTPDGETALHWAIKCGHEELARFLIAHSADGEIKDNIGMTPLQLAVENGYTEILEKLIVKGVLLTEKEEHYDRSLLHLASINGHLSIVEMLLDKGLKINMHDKRGKNPLYYAEKYGHGKVGGLLKKRGASINNNERDWNSSPSLKKGLDEKEAIIWYLGSCGWAIKTKNHFLIFDYWEYGRKPTEPSLLNGHINPGDIEDLNVYVFVTHSHIDHYDPIIYEWKKTIKNIKYIFGWKADDDPEHLYMIGPRAVEKVDDIEIFTINSHHVDVPEVAYLIKVEGITIYFNGDYNGKIHEDIRYLSTKSDKIDLAFSEGGASVTSHLIESMKPIMWFPMHERGTEFKHQKYKHSFAKTNFMTKVICAENRGDRFYYK